MEENSIIVRFSMPRDGSCRVCQAKLRSGSKFNALKTASALGISQFQFFCKVCKGKFIVSAHPHRDFYVFEGALEESILQNAEDLLEEDNSGNREVGSTGKNREENLYMF